MSIQSINPQELQSHPLHTRPFLVAASLAGVVIALLGNLPLINLVNLFLCMWVWVGGALAVYLYRRLAHAEVGLTVMQGAGLGALAGLFGAVLGVFIYALTSMVSIPLFASLASLLHVEGALAFTNQDAGTMAGSALVFFLLDAVLYPLFGAISGAIATSLMDRQKPSPA